MRNDENLLDEDQEDERDDVAREGDDDPGDVHPFDDDEDDAPLPPSQTAASAIPVAPLASTTAAPISINDEMRERMERNKRLAMERRMARLQVLSRVPFPPTSRVHFTASFIDSCPLGPGAT